MNVVLGLFLGWNLGNVGLYLYNITTGPQCAGELLITTAMVLLAMVFIKK